MALRVRLQQNISHMWIIVPSENLRLAWSGSRWVPVDRDGISASAAKVAHFEAASDAFSYAQSVGFEVEHG